MSKFYDKINAYFQADWWSGGSWLVTLCVIQLVVGGFYVFIHYRMHGHEFVQLEEDQLKTLNDLVAIYPDTQLPTSLLEEYKSNHPKDTAKGQVADSISFTRIQRSKMVKDFLFTAYHGDVDEGQLDSLELTLRELNTRDAVTYITAKRFWVSSYFWLSGGLMYWEALLWSFIGVLTSLIYYVSLANTKFLKNVSDGDIGPFDTSEISGQVAKMFYAPAITLVLVLGYNYLSGNNKGMVNIGVNHGLILFSFIAGFYSGRLMKLLDGLKNLILPTSSDGGKTDNGGDGAASGKGDITVQLGLSATMAADPDGAGIAEAGYNNAVVTLQPAGKKGDPIALTAPGEDQGSVFTGSGVAFGSYTVNVQYAFNNRTTIVNLVGSKDIVVDAGHLSFAVELNKMQDQG